MTGLLRSGSFEEFGQRVARRVYRASGAESLEFPLRVTDIVDSAQVLAADRSFPTPQGKSLSVSWLCAPPGANSGGHATMFRMVAALEEAGHRCRIVLYDPHGVDLPRFTAVIRSSWPHVRASVVDIDDGLADADALVATSWQSAHVLGARPHTRGTRLYFVQDYEPFFYPRGTEYALAEDSYRFGFHVLALGRMVHDEILERTGTSSTTIEFGCDVHTYELMVGPSRNGVAFYSRPETARRGSLLAGLALDIFHGRRPDQTIHLIGPRPSTFTAPAVEHGTIRPAELARLYNHTIAGIGLSFTNVSLVVEEMALCGTVPIVNESARERLPIAHPGVVWAAPTPTDIADALCAVVDHPAPDERAREVARSHRPTPWSKSGKALVDAVEVAVRSSVQLGSTAPAGNAKEQIR